MLVSFLGAFAHEDNPNVWNALAMVISSLDHVLLGCGSAVLSNFRTFVSALISDAVAKIGWVPRAADGHLDRIQRSTLLGLVCRFSTRAEDLAEARARFDAVIAAPHDPAACPSELRTAVYQMVLAHGGTAEYAALKGTYALLQSDAERKQVMAALGYTPGAAERKAAMDWAISGAVKLQDFFVPFMSVGAASPASMAQAWEYLQANFAHVRTMTAATPSLLNAAIGGCCAGFTTDARAAEVEAFFAANPQPESARKISQVIEAIRVAAGYGRRLEGSAIAQPTFWVHGALFE